jgi:hypothetical protein
MRRCRETGDFSPVIFEWYKFVGGLCFTFANLSKKDFCTREDVSNREYGILIGLINRFAKLICAFGY